MSELEKTPAQAEETSLSSITDLLETLVPPKSINIEDIFGNEYKVSSSVSARRQIQILREFDKLKDMDGEISIDFGDMMAIMNSLVELAMNEKIFSILCNCFYLAHEDIVKKTMEQAKESNTSFTNGSLGAGDLFGIEEIVAGIVPLFIRLARRTGKALATLAA